MARRRRTQRGGRATTWSLPEAARAARTSRLTHTHRPPDDRPGDRPRRSPATRCRCTRSATPSTASSCAARASWPRWRRSPTRSRCTPAIRCRPTRRRRTRSASRIPMDTPGLIFLCRDSASRAGREPFDHPLSIALRRAGRVRDLRRRRGPARPGLHRRRPRRLQLGHAADCVVAEHHAADHAARADQAGVRVRPRDRAWPRR